LENFPAINKKRLLLKIICNQSLKLRLVQVVFKLVTALTTDSLKRLLLATMHSSRAVVTAIVGRFLLTLQNNVVT